MFCPKCAAEIQDGSVKCPECEATFDIHVSSFAGSVHWEDQVKPASSESEKRRTFLICGIILAVTIVLWFLIQIGWLPEIIQKLIWELRWLIHKIRFQ